MKTLTASLITLFLGLSIQTANAQKPTSELEAQMQITHDRANKVMRDLVSLSSTATYQNADFTVRSKVLHQALETKLVKLDQYLKSQIFNPSLAAMIDRYNGIATSSQYASDQKNMILEPLYQQLDGNLKNAAKGYQEQIFEIYKLVGDLPGQDGYWYDEQLYRSPFGLETQKLGHFCFRTLISQSVTSDFYTARATKSYMNQDNVYELPSFADSREMNDTILIQNVYPVLKKDCYSQSCIGLTTAELTVFAKSVKNNLDQDVVVKLGDGRTLTLSALNFNASIIFKALQTKMTYPAEHYALPFDISADQLPAVQQKRAEEVAQAEATRSANGIKRAELVAQAFDALLIPKRMKECPPGFDELMSQLQKVGGFTNDEVIKLNEKLDAEHPYRAKDLSRINCVIPEFQKRTPRPRP